MQQLTKMLFANYFPYFYIGKCSPKIYLVGLFCYSGGSFLPILWSSPQMETPQTQESFSFPHEEEKILKFWNENQIFKKSLDKTKNNKNYIFYDGPPFATGLPHHGHIVASTLKDIIPRYFTMKGYYVSRRFGWDCH